MSRKKVTVVGGGFVGSTTAQRIVDKELADVVLTDILDGPPAGKALDMLESGPITRTDSRGTGISTGGRTPPRSAAGCARSIPGRELSRCSTARR